MPYVAPLVVAALVIGGMALVALPQRTLPGVRWFLAFSVALVVWSLAYAAELLAPSEGYKLLAAKSQYLGIAAVPVAWLAFVVAYSGIIRWSRPAVVALILVPLTTLFLAWTNEAHELIWSSWDLTTGLPYTVLDLGHGAWFWVHVAFSYACLLTATGLLIRVLVVRPPLFRRQAGLLLVASVTPWLGNVLYISGLGPEALDLTVFGFALSGVLSAWAILRWNLLAIGPIARDAIVEGMSEAMVVVDREWRVVDVNPSGAALLGKSAGELVGWDARPVLERFGVRIGHPDDDRLFVEAPDGRAFDCRLDSLPDSRGTVRGWALVFHDVTDRAEEAKALERARRMADETARAQRAFLANMNHELRTPLNGVIGMLQVLLLTDLDDAQGEYVQTAHASAEELLGLLGRILDFTTLESGRVVLDEVPFDPGNVVRAAASDARTRAEEKGLDFVVEVGPAIPRVVLGDPQRLGQVVATLAGNAVKFTASGSVHVRALTESLSGDEVRLRVEVEDTGIGIPPERLESIFRGFVQGDSSSTRRHEGAGLGLSIAEGLVARMGGDLRVESEEGTGTRFWLTVPFRVPTPAEAGEVETV